VKAEGQNEMIVKVERILSKKDIESFIVVSDEEADSTVGDVQNEMIGDKSRERSTIAKELSLLYSCSNIKGLETDISISFSACDETLHAIQLMSVKDESLVQLLKVDNRFSNLAPLESRLLTESVLGAITQRLNFCCQAVGACVAKLGNYIADRCAKCGLLVRTEAH
jgi:hypothetical protein